MLDRRYFAALDGRASITANLVKRLELAGLGLARVNLTEQAAYDLWQGFGEQRNRKCTQARYRPAKPWGIW